MTDEEEHPDAELWRERLRRLQDVWHDLHSRRSYVMGELHTLDQQLEATSAEIRQLQERLDME